MTPTGSLSLDADARILENRRIRPLRCQGWAFGGTDSSGETVWTRDYIVHGNRTPGSAMPTGGTATYAGRMEGAEFPSDDAISSGSRTRYLGDVTLTADFAAADVAGEFSNLVTRVGGGSYSSAAGGATFDATIDGNRFTAGNLNGTGALSDYLNGNVRGAFSVLRLRKRAVSSMLTTRQPIKSFMAILEPPGTTNKFRNRQARKPKQKHARFAPL